MFVNRRHVDYMYPDEQLVSFLRIAVGVVFADAYQPNETLSCSRVAVPCNQLARSVHDVCKELRI